MLSYGLNYEIINYNGWNEDKLAFIIIIFCIS